MSFSLRLLMVAYCCGVTVLEFFSIVIFRSINIAKDELPPNLTISCLLFLFKIVNYFK
jgi:hypothetical protein